METFVRATPNDTEDRKSASLEELCSPAFSNILQRSPGEGDAFSSVLQVKEMPSPAFSSVLQRSLAAGSSQKFASGLMSFQP
ncbi:unnamed protein product [Boreogadus saida]